MKNTCAVQVEQIAKGFKENKHIFAALGDETRQLIILVLLEGELQGIRVNEIAKKAHLTRPSASHHLQILKATGIVGMRKEGTKNYYYLNEDEIIWKEIAELVHLIHQTCVQFNDKKAETKK